MNDLDLRSVRYFLAVAEERHIGRAAQWLSISQPALTMQIRRFEQALGVSLIRKVGRGIKLTAAGHVLLEGARDLLAHAQDILDETVRAGRRSTERIQIESDGVIQERRKAYPPELRERAVRLVAESRQHHDSEWAAIRWAAAKVGIGTPETVRLWVRQAQDT